VRNRAFNSLDRVLDADKGLTHIIGLAIVSATASVPERHRDRKRATLLNQLISCGC
jgi:hypothetical protein